MAHFLGVGQPNRSCFDLCCTLSEYSKGTSCAVYYERFPVSFQCKLVTVKSFKADVSSVSPSSEQMVLEMSALKLVASLCYQLS